MADNKTITVELERLPDAMFLRKELFKITGNGLEVCATTSAPNRILFEIHREGQETEVHCLPLERIAAALVEIDPERIQ